MTAPSLETTPAQPRSGGPDAFEAQPSQAESPFPYPPLSRTAAEILKNPEFRAGRFDTGFVERTF